MGIKPQGPNEILVWAVDWTSRLPSGTTLLTSNWVAPSGASIVQSLISGNQTLFRVQITDPALLGQTIEFTNTVTISDGEKEVRRPKLHIVKQ